TCAISVRLPGIATTAPPFLSAVSSKLSTPCANWACRIWSLLPSLSAHGDALGLRSISIYSLKRRRSLGIWSKDSRNSGFTSTRSGTSTIPWPLDFRSVAPTYSSSCAVLLQFPSRAYTLSAGDPERSPAASSQRAPARRKGRIMNKRLPRLLALFALFAIVLQTLGMTSEERKAYLEKLVQTLPAVPSFNTWLERTRELPPDFDALPKINELPDL